MTRPLRIVLTLLVRDEVDIVADMLRWHLGQGVDHVIAMDNGSTDGTTEILEDFAAMGVLTRLDQPSDAYLQDVWGTDMARMAQDDLGADWVIPSDADEFWMPADPARTLRDELGAVPDGVALVDCARHTLCAPWDDIAALGWRDALIWRAARPRPVTGARLRDPAPLSTPYAYAWTPPKAILRPGRLTRIGRGGHSHDIDMEGDGAPSRLDAGIAVHHAPFRAPDEVLASIARIGAAIAADAGAGPDVSAKYRRWHAMAAGAGTADGTTDGTTNGAPNDTTGPVLAEIVPSAADLACDRLSGQVRADTRLRDATALRMAGLAARMALAGAPCGPDRDWLDPMAPPCVVLLAGGAETARARVAARLHRTGVRPIDDGVDWPDRIAALLRLMGGDCAVPPDGSLLAELRASQHMHSGHWNNLLLDVPDVAAAIPVWRALHDSGDLTPVVILLADAKTDAKTDAGAGDAGAEVATRGLPRLIAPSHRIAAAAPAALQAALACLGVSVPLSVALASAPERTDPVPVDPGLSRCGWGLKIGA